MIMRMTDKNLTVDELLFSVDHRDLSKEEAIYLLNVENGSKDFYKIIEKANAMTRQEYQNKAYIFSQIGLNAKPCSGNCKFCSMAANNYVIVEEFQKSMKDIDQLKELATSLVRAGTHDIFLMTTADYPLEEYLEIGKAIRGCLPDSVRLVANIGDFDLETAFRLKSVGFTGVYHIKRLREGVDTDIDPEIRLQTIQNVHDSGLELYYCIEPIGPEHSYDELAEEMLRARALDVKAMAVMRRTPVPGTPMAQAGMISSVELTKIAAVTRLVSRPSRSMNVHEVTPMSLLAGVNQLYAEAGANPRDQVSDTSVNRGYSVSSVANLLLDAEFELA